MDKKSSQNSMTRKVETTSPGQVSDSETIFSAANTLRHWHPDYQEKTSHHIWGQSPNWIFGRPYLLTSWCDSWNPIPELQKMVPSQDFKFVIPRKVDQFCVKFLHLSLHTIACPPKGTTPNTMRRYSAPFWNREIQLHQIECTKTALQYPLKVAPSP